MKSSSSKLEWLGFAVPSPSFLSDELAGVYASGGGGQQTTQKSFSFSSSAKNITRFFLNE